MALLYMDSFDHYVTADLTEKWTATGALFGGSTAINVSGRHSSSAFRCTPGTGNNSSTAYIQKSITTSDATFIVGFALNISSLATVGTAGMPLLQIRDASAAQITLRVNSAGTLAVTRGQHNGTVLGTTTATLTAGTFAYIELKVLINATTGTVDLKINGTSALSLTAQNTKNSGTSWSSVILGIFDSVGSTNAQTGGTLDFDDLYVLDGTGSSPLNTFLGDCRVDARVPTGAGATTAWTPSTGSNYQNVDDPAPNDDTDYNSTTTIGSVDTFVVQDAPVAGATIFGIQHCLSAKKLDASAVTIAPVVRHSGADYVGTDISPTTAYTYGLVVQATNPGTGAAWTEAGFNAAEFGYKRTA